MLIFILLQPLADIPTLFRSANLSARIRGDLCFYDKATFYLI